MYPELGRLIAQSGSEIGNHKLCLFRPVWSLEAEIIRTNGLIRETGYTGPITFRPPYNIKFITLPYAVRQYGMETVTWSLEPNTFMQDDPGKAIERALSGVRPGCIIVMHPTDNATSLDILEAVITGLQAQGYRFVTVSELLAMKSPSAVHGWSSGERGISLAAFTLHFWGSRRVVYKYQSFYANILINPTTATILNWY